MLSIVPTPIGNLRDITLRALDVLKAADLIVCEDTRHTGNLLRHFEISKPLASLHEHSSDAKVLDLVKRLEGGLNVALVSDAGMPLISDPGFELMKEVRERGLSFEVLPGAQAAVTALVASGLATDSFVFLGFPSPKSAGRKKEFERLAAYEETLIYYESPFRLVKTLEDMKEVWGNREAAVSRELTKKFEETARGTLEELIQKFSAKNAIGEIVITVSGANRKKLFEKVVRE